MATKKQRRRQLKERRHEYEYVYVDDEGQEVEVEDEEPQPSASPAKAKAAKGRGRPAREPKPPSWERQFKRAPVFGVLLFLVTSFGHHPALGTRIEFAVLYTALFIPLMYLFERSLYRTFLKRTGKLPPPGSRRS